MSEDVRVVLATRNPHKLLEVRRILADTPAAAISLLSIADFPHAPDVAETGQSFAENALLKAAAAASATALPALADDSGLSVDALNGMPGVFSARWAGRHGDDLANLTLLLDQIADLPDDRRGAAFVCAAALVAPAGHQVVEEGRLAGRLARAPRGSNGFGYDPIFVPDGESRTTAEMSPSEKDALSHRARAFRAIAPHLARLPDLSDPDAGLDRDTAATDHDEVIGAELSLLNPAIRSDPVRVRELLHADFFEFGASGRLWDLPALIDSFAVDPFPPPGNVTELAPVLLADDVVLLTYRLSGGSGASLRSSVWVRSGGHWRLRFHQGTPTPRQQKPDR